MASHARLIPSPSAKNRTGGPQSPLLLMLLFCMFVASCAKSKEVSPPPPPTPVNSSTQDFFIARMQSGNIAAGWALLSSNPWSSESSYVLIYETKPPEARIFRDGQEKTITLSDSIKWENFHNKLTELNNQVTEDYDSGAFDSINFDFIYAESDKKTALVKKKIHLNPGLDKEHPVNQLIRHLFSVDEGLDQQGKSP